MIHTITILDGNDSQVKQAHSFESADKLRAWMIMRFIEELKEGDVTLTVEKYVSLLGERDEENVVYVHNASGDAETWIFNEVS